MSIRALSRSGRLTAVSMFVTWSAAAQAQLAGSWDRPPVAIVRYADLDLRSERGAAELRSRVRRAVSAMYRAASFDELPRRAIIMRAEKETLARSEVQVEAVIRSVRATAARSGGVPS